MDANKMTPAELRELADKKEKTIANIPPVKSDIDWSGVIKLANQKAIELAENGYIDDEDDTPQFFFEKVMTTIYGPDIFKWWNKQYR
jgi:hypothetical protein